MIYSEFTILRKRVHQAFSKNRPRQSIEDWDCLDPTREGGVARVAHPAITYSVSMT